MSGDTRKGSERLVDSLVTDLRPVRAVRWPMAVAAAVGVEAIVVVVALLVLGVDSPRLARLADPVFAGLVAALALGAAVSAAAATTLAIPGRDVDARVRLAALTLPLLLAGIVVAFSPWGSSWTGLWAVMTEGAHCLRGTVAVAVPAWAAGLLLLRRLGPLDPLRVGLFSGLSALLTAAIVVQLACANCEAWHLALTHYAPLLLLAWAAAATAPVFLTIGRSANAARGTSND